MLNGSRGFGFESATLITKQALQNPTRAGFRTLLLSSPSSPGELRAEAIMAPPPPLRTGVAKRRMRSKDAAERSAYFARREAAAVLRRVLRGDARRRATASIKSLVYSPSVRNKKATLALVCQTLKCNYES